MRYKFRAWDKQNNRWFPLSEIPSERAGVWLGCCGTLFAWERAFPEPLVDGVYEINMYTGLKDKNGKSIFEGDIVKENGTIGVIYYMAPSFVVSDKEGEVWYLGGGMSYPKPSNLLQTEVVGNLYEHPHLLEVKP